MLEVERKFIVVTAPQLGLHDGASIQQGYLLTGDPELRVREKDGSYCLTLKRGTGLSREEVEEEISSALGGSLLIAAGTRVVSKRRLQVSRWEIDYYAGALAGLIVAEVELIEESERLPSLRPGFDLGPEVTDDPQFKNQALAVLSPDEAKTLVTSVSHRPAPS